LNELKNRIGHSWVILWVERLEWAIFGVLGGDEVLGVGLDVVEEVHAGLGGAGRQGLVG